MKFFSGFFFDILLLAEKRFAEVSARSEHFLKKKGVAHSGRTGLGRGKSSFLFLRILVGYVTTLSDRRSDLQFSFASRFCKNRAWPTTPTGKGVAFFRNSKRNIWTSGHLVPKFQVNRAKGHLLGAVLSEKSRKQGVVDCGRTGLGQIFSLFFGNVLAQVRPSLKVSGQTVRPFSQTG